MLFVAEAMLLVLEVILEVAASTRVVRFAISVVFVLILAVFELTLVSSAVILAVFEPTVVFNAVIEFVFAVTLPVSVVMLDVAVFKLPVKVVIDPVAD